MTGSALSGVRILDLSRILAGPYCTQLLGDLGADVIKIERPGVGDDTRQWGPPFLEGPDGDTQESGYYLSANRNKRSAEIDLHSAEGHKAILDLLENCDVLIENFKVGDLARAGLDYATLAPRFPGLIYCSISGFGQTGPNAHRPGYDLLAQGWGGIMSLTGDPEGEPIKVAVGIVDIMTGMYAATGILAALRHRDRTGEGQAIDVALVDVMTSWLANEGVNTLLTGRDPIRRGNQHPSIVPYQVFAVRDGHVIIACGNDDQYQKLCRILAVEELADDPRFCTNPQRLRHRDELIPLIADIAAKWSKAELISAMETAGVPGGPINTLTEVFEDPQAIARGMRIEMPHSAATSGVVPLIGNPLKLSATPIAYRLPPPQRGEHTTQVLRQTATQGV
ncbi:crotonobetainyl-CoA:carnitine CoA-transferase CaiB-like acyl-CoA transferase [Mycobacterium frederiksbergense]|uniref:Crotonobetainyl-CoA:carnitine CoA-transferase CaiB-like acyl-CoA transferase n=1 Tax=Mycolicibacterium frederiksbergense TaxID=117567 RepID=A0ABT6L9E2_9MYCO|nr:CoA transferase [Mycolicibacterium frederiksbergense]MDH6198605.1 crotonobetainyl-CoA:carnitine CoA-transferase CaiB-like acyl-CoA transferase [Mycolicibacterium frederiksbergense]